MNIKVQQNLDTKELYFHISQFSPLYDVDKISFYSMKEKGGVLILKFYDKNKKLLKPRKKNEKA